MGRAVCGSRGVRQPGLALMLVTCSGEAGRASRKIRRDETRIWRSIQPRSSSLSAKSREARKAKRSRFKNQSDSTFPFESKYPEINFSSCSLLGSVRFIPLPRTTSKDVRAMHRRISLSRVINDRRSGERSILAARLRMPFSASFPSTLFASMRNIFTFPTSEH